MRVVRRAFGAFLHFVACLFASTTHITAWSAQIADTFTRPLANVTSISQQVGVYEPTYYCGNHLGQDLPAAPDTPVYAVANGIVRYSHYITNAGRSIRIEHTLTDGSKLVSVYFHLKNALAAGQVPSPGVGEDVTKGQIIGYVTGIKADYGTGPHVHFGMRLGPYTAGTDPRTGVTYYPGYSALFSAGQRICNQLDPRHATITAEWIADPIAYIDARQGGTAQTALSPLRDIWTTSTYSYAPGGGGPGGGLNDNQLRVGGWGDEYRALIQFDLSNAPLVASAATLRLYNMDANGGAPVSMFLDRVTSSWDWTTQPITSLSPDNLRLWWVNRPTFVQLTSLPAPTVGSYYEVDLTNLYNQWKSGTVPNFGIQLRATSFSNRFNDFASFEHATVDWRPLLIVNGATFTGEACPCNTAAATSSIFSSDPNAVCLTGLFGEQIVTGNGGLLTYISTAPGASGGYCFYRVNGVYQEYRSVNDAQAATCQQEIRAACQ